MRNLYKIEKKNMKKRGYLETQVYKLLYLEEAGYTNEY
jgi:hypothetical protein